MPCVFMRIRGVLHFELVPDNHDVNADLNDYRDMMLGKQAGIGQSNSDSTTISQHKLLNRKHEESEGLEVLL